MRQIYGDALDRERRTEREGEKWREEAIGTRVRAGGGTWSRSRHGECGR